MVCDSPAHFARCLALVFLYFHARCINVTVQCTLSVQFVNLLENFASNRIKNLNFYILDTSNKTR